MNSGLYDIPPEKMQQLMDESNGAADVLRKIGFSPYGGDHPTFNKYVKEFGLDTTKMD
jgi:hypothetical protein